MFVCSPDTLTIAAGKAVMSAPNVYAALRGGDCYILMLHVPMSRSKEATFRAI